jgi:hypothetical protein
MATTYTLIENITLATSAASITFSAIAADWTDLKIVCSTRDTSTADSAGNILHIKFNGSSSGFSQKLLYGTGSSASSGSYPQMIGESATNATTSNTFGSTEVYIPNYTSSSFKSYSGDSVNENNATGAYATLAAGLWSSVDSITSITILPSGAWNLVANSTFSLYGISNS